MLMKLALRNVRRSVRDYAVYFVTLTLGVAVFYAFNAIGDSRVLFEAQEGAANVFLASGASIFDILVLVMTYFSIVVAVVLGFLVLYANRFVVRARKKEFGTYLLLGMSPRQVSSVVLMESLIVGVIALVVGLGLGFLISQAIAFARIRHDSTNTMRQTMGLRTGMRSLRELAENSVASLQREICTALNRATTTKMSAKHPRVSSADRALNSR